MSDSSDNGSLQCLIEALANSDAAPLRDYLAQLGVDVAAVRALPRWNSPPGQVVKETLSSALRVTVPKPSAAALLALYVWYECEQAWEISYHFNPIWATLREIDQLWPDHRDLAPADGDRAVMDAVLRGLRLLDLAIAVENEQTCGTLSRHCDAARMAVRAAEVAAEAAAQAEAAHPQIAQYVIEQATSCRRYYIAVAEAVDAVEQTLRGEPHALPAAIEKLREAEADREVLDDIDRSELRAHRFSLQELAEATDQEWVTLEHGKIVYLYPFGLRGIGAAVAVDRARDDAVGWQLAGVDSVDVRQRLDLDDVWAGSDFLGRRFDGVAIVLPRLTMTDVEGQPLAVLNAELRLSELGNHYLRLEAHAHEMDPHELQFALFRAAPEHGTVKVVCGGTARVWPRLSAFAVDLIQALPAVLAKQDERVKVSVRPGMYHVMVRMDDATIGTGPAAPAELRRPARDAAEVTRAVGGQVLLHPVENCVGAIAEWIRNTPTGAQVIEGAGRKGDLLARTDNTTLLVMLGTPSFQIGAYETFAEFAASLDGLFGAWFDELAAHHHEVMAMLERISTAGEELDHLVAGVDKLRAEQLRLHDFAAAARSVLGLIRSPALVLSPLDATILRRLLDASGYERVERDFASKVAELLDDQLGTRLQALANQHQEAVDREAAIRERRGRIRMDTLLAVIAGAGVSGVVQVLQAGLDLGAPGAMIGSGVVICIAVAAGAVVRLLSGRTDRPIPGRGET